MLSGGKEVKSELEGIEGVIERNKGKLLALGTAFTAVGAAGLALVQTNKQLNTSLALTGTTLGLSLGKMQDLAIATADAGFPLKEVAAAFDVLTRAGVRDTTEMKNAAKAFDALGDATGSTADAMATALIPGLKALGEQLPQNASDLDKFTWLAKNTTVTLDDFGSVMNYVALYGKDLNLSSSDIVKTLAALEAQGIKGTAATRAFRTAVQEATKENISLNEALGLTTEEVEQYNEEIEDATGSTEKYSKAADKQITFMDKVKAKFSEITLKMSAFLGPLQPILAAMTAMGPVMMFLGTATGMATVKLVAHTAALVAMTVATTALKIGILAWTAAQWILNVALTANPIGIVIAAVAALIGIVVLLVKNWDHVANFFKSLWEGIKVIFWAVVDWMKEWGILFLGPIGFIIKYWEEVVAFFKKIPGWIKAAFEGLVDIVLAPFRAIWKGIEVGVNWMIRQLNKISFTLPSWIPGIGGKTWGVNIPEVTLPAFSQGGVIPEPTILYGMKSQRPYAIAGERGTEYVSPAGHGGSVTIEMTDFNGRVLARAIAPHLVDLIRLRTGIKY